MKRSDDRAAVFFRAQLAKVLDREFKPRFGTERPLRIVDVGSGKGYWLQYLQASQTEVFGADIDSDRVHASKAAAPAACVCVADGRALPWPDAAFDAVCQFVVFTSVTRSADKQAIAREMRRVVKPGGSILWYDFFAPNPLNRKTKPVRQSEIASLFPDCRITVLRRVTLLPPLARLALRFHAKIAEFLDRISFLHTHYLIVLEKAVKP